MLLHFNPSHKCLTTTDDWPAFGRIIFTQGLENSFVEKGTWDENESEVYMAARARKSRQST